MCVDAVAARASPQLSCYFPFFCFRQTASRCFTSFDALPRLRRRPSDHLSWNNWLTHSHSLSLYLPTVLRESLLLLGYVYVYILEYLSLRPDESVLVLWIFSFYSSFFNSVTIDNTAGEMMSFVSLLFPRERDPSHFKCYLYTWDLTAGLGGKNAVVFPR